MMTDTIADMLTRIRNAQLVRKSTITLPFSKVKKQIATILVDEGYLAKVEEVRDLSRAQLLLTLKYKDREPVIRVIRRISTPGRRVYVQATNLPYVFDDFGIAIISTSCGLMTNKRARNKRLGGEVICEVF